MDIISGLKEHSHKRYNILTGEWVLVSPHRAKRPWQGQEEETSIYDHSTYDSDCYLCAGNMRANGEKNPNYTSTYVFENDFAALKKSATNKIVNTGLLKATGEQGLCKVICFSPDHSKTLADLSVNDISKIVETWQQEFIILKKLDFINYVQIFENKGAVMGCSNSHPHGQIWAQSSIPNEVEKKDKYQQKYYEENNASLLGDYIQQEIKLKERILFINEYFVILIPFWATWPFETMIIPLKHQQDISCLTPDENNAFAEAISILTKAYDAVFNCSFPYSSGIHQAPTNNYDNTYWHWHMSFYPPLLRSATIKKFMVGYEMFGMPQRDITAEKAADILRNLIFN